MRLNSLTRQDRHSVEARPARLRWRLLATGGARLWSAGGSFVILVISARWLGPHGRGLYASAVAWATLGSALLYLSLGQVALHDVAGSAPDAAWFGRALGTLLGFMLGLTVVSWGIAVVTFAITDGAAFKPLSLDILLLGLLLLPLLIWEQYGSALLSIAGRLRVYNRAQAMGRSVAVLAVVGFLVAGMGIYGVLLGTILGEAIVAFTGIQGLLARSEDLHISFEFARRLLRGGARLHLSAVGTVLITTTDVLIVGHFRGAGSVGAYQLATQALYALMLVPQAATLVVYERVASDGARAAWEVHRRVVPVVLFAVSAIAVVAAVAASPLIHAAAGGRFAAATTLLPVILLGVPGFALSALMAPQWIGRGLFGVASAVTVLCGTANVLANLILVPRYGASGAAITLVVTSALMLLPNLWLAVRCERERIHPNPAPRPGPDDTVFGSGQA